MRAAAGNPRGGETPMKADAQPEDLLPCLGRSRINTSKTLPPVQRVSVGYTRNRRQGANTLCMFKALLYAEIITKGATLCEKTY